jgi:hypothetical protein
MQGALYTYLLQHKSLSIPGLGTIFVERVPAQSDFVNKQLLPPSYHFRFNKYFDAPDKDFFSYLASQSNLADYEAIRWYNEWAFALHNEIRADNPVNLENIGVLRKDISGEILFEADRPVPSYLETVPAHRVIRSNSKHKVIVGDWELSSEQAAEFLQDEIQVEKESYWIYALVIVAFSMIVLFFHFYKNGFNSDAIGNQQTIHVLP